jgi:type IV pilus assembly protein PilV
MLNRTSFLLKRKSSAGFTLLEVLVSIVVLAFGLMGLAGLMTVGLKSNHSAYMRSQATVLATDIMDRIRANRQAAMLNRYNLALGATPGSADAIAQADLTAWKAAIEQALPSGQGSVNVAAQTKTIGGVNVNIPVLTVQIQWDDSRGQGATGYTESFQTQTSL